MGTGRRFPRWTPLSWVVALLVVSVGAVWVTATLLEQGPGDSGPVVGNSVMEHLQVGLLYGAAIVLLAAVAGWLVAVVAGRSRERGRDRSAANTHHQ